MALTRLQNRTLWGIVMVTMGLCHNFAGLATARWWLGFAEAGLFPGVNYYLSCWQVELLKMHDRRYTNCIPGTSARNWVSEQPFSSQQQHWQVHSVDYWQQALLR
jgi:hypothetical protein